MRAGEDKLVHGIAEALALKSSTRVVLGAGDDAALLTPRSGFEIILTCDWFLEGSHFLPRLHPSDSVGWKCLARAVSDIAAMGGRPTCFLLSLALSRNVLSSEKGWTVGWLQRFGCVLAGGDTTRSRQILISLTVIGEVPTGLAIRRSGAKPGDKIFVSGTLGQADLGLQILRGGARISSQNGPSLRKHLYPEPRLALGQWLARRKLASSMMDISDGLSSDLARLCAASRVGAQVEAAQIPLLRMPAAGSKRRFDALDLALNGGDDYELLFTVGTKDAARIPRSLRGIALTEIGEITRDRRLMVVERGKQAKPLVPRGWDPFRK
jgi:thiamine-monophosphate kinase